MSLTDREIQELIDAQLPPWVVGRAHGKLVLGAQLPTRDGRRIGNAHIIQIADKTYQSQGVTLTLYLILTDAGNTATMTDVELCTAFHDPMYYSEVKDIIAKFWHDPDNPPCII